MALKYPISLGGRKCIIAGDKYLKILLILDPQSVNGSTLLDLAGGFDRVVFEVAMFTFETLQDDVSEVRDSEQKQARDSE